MKLKPCIACGHYLQFACGNCARCFQRHNKMVKRGKTTREELIAQGKMLPAESRATRNNRIFFKTNGRKQ